MTKTQFTTIAALLAVLAVIQLAPIVVPSRTAPQYEYKIEAIKDLDIVDDLGRLGRGGWELVFARRALTSEADGREGIYEAIFKRPL